MDKNNDIKVNKVSKWKAAPESIKEMHDIITGVCDVLIDYDDDNKCEKMMVDALSKVLDDYNELEAKYNTDCGMISQYAENEKKYEIQKEKNMELASKNRALGMEISERCKQIHELKDTLEKDRELAKLVGENVVECIKYGAEHGYYEVHPLNRFDIHIEETHVGSIQDRHAIPKIVVRCNNVRTEMERDTAQHECEELNEKVDRLWRVNEELNRKIKGLKKENKELKATLAVCAVDANTAKKLCNGIVSKAKRTRNNKEEK